MEQNLTKLACRLFAAALRAAPPKDPDLKQIMVYDELPAESKAYWLEIAKEASR